MLHHPLYVMWKERYDAELVAQAERGRRRAARAQEEREWGEAWESYQRRWHAGRVSPPPQGWWHCLRAWLAAAVSGEQKEGQGRNQVQVTRRSRAGDMLHGVWWQ
jgi:hypothetical protein